MGINNMGGIMKLNNSRKYLKIIGLMLIILVIIFIGLFLYRKLNPRVITSEQTENVTAEIYYREFWGYDASTGRHYYFYKLKNDNYLYLKTTNEVTIKGAGEEYIVEKGQIKNRKQLINIIDDLEKEQIKQENIATVTLTFYYNNNKVSKDDFINLFAFD